VRLSVYNLLAFMWDYQAFMAEGIFDGLLEAQGLGRAGVAALR
jgi:hypothetical protein